jgi:WD40 repeat protein
MLNVWHPAQPGFRFRGSPVPARPLLAAWLLALLPLPAWCAEPPARPERSGEERSAGTRSRPSSLGIRQPSRVMELHYTPDGRTLLSEGEDRTLRAWDVASGQERYHYRILVEKDSLAMLLSPDGRLGVTGLDFNHPLVLWDPVAGKRIGRLPGSGCNVLRATFSPDGKALAALAAHDPDETRVHVWDLPTGRERHNWLACKNEPRAGFPIAPLTFVRGGRVLAAVARNERGEMVTRLWDLRNGKALPAGPGLREHAGDLTLSPDARVLAGAVDLGADRAGVRLWDIATGKKLRDLDRPPDELGRNLRFSPDGGILATMSPEEPCLWDVASGKRLPAPEAGKDEPWDVVFSHDGRKVAIQEGGVVYLCQVPTGKRIYRLKPRSLSDDETLDYPPSSYGGMPFEFDWPLVAFSPDDQVLAAAVGNCIHLWELRTGKEVTPEPPGHAEPKRPRRGP